MGKYNIARIKFGDRQFHHTKLEVRDYSSAQELLEEFLGVCAREMDCK